VIEKIGNDFCIFGHRDSYTRGHNLAHQMGIDANPEFLSGRLAIAKVDVTLGHGKALMGHPKIR
jgi:hypothetical protein